MLFCHVLYYVECLFVNNISVISWRSVLLVEKTGVPWENHWPVASHWQALSHNVVSSTHNFSGDKHWLHRYFEIQLPCDHKRPWNKYWRNDPLMVRTPNLTRISCSFKKLMLSCCTHYSPDFMSIKHGSILWPKQEIVVCLVDVKVGHHNLVMYS